MTKKEPLMSKKQFDNQREYALSVYCIYMLIILSLYNLSMEFVSYFQHIEKSSTIMTSLVMIIFVLLFVRMVKTTGYPLSLFGFTLKKWKKYVIESILFSVLFCLFITFLKWLCLQNMSIFAKESLFQKATLGEYFDTYTLIYIAFTPLQCFMAQGAVQAPLLEFLPKNIKRTNLLAILVSTMIFAAIHVELNIFYAIGVLLPGLLWAFMFVRHRMLLSVTLSHIIVGVYAFSFLDLTTLFNRLHQHYLSL